MFSCTQRISLVLTDQVPNLSARLCVVSELYGVSESCTLGMEQNYIAIEASKITINIIFILLFSSSEVDYGLMLQRLEILRVDIHLINESKIGVVRENFHV